MELNHLVVTDAPRASATVVLLRDDRGAGLEVLLLRRHSASAVLGGADVFPGGKLDDGDAPGTRAWPTVRLRCTPRWARPSSPSARP